MTTTTKPQTCKKNVTLNATKERMAEMIQDSLPIRRELETKKDIVSAFVESVSGLEAMHNAMRQMIEDSITASIHVSAAQTHAKDLYNMAREEIKAPTWNFVTPDFLDWQTTKGAAETLLEKCRTKAKGLATLLVAEFFNILDEMVESNYFGICTFDADDPEACMYHFYRSVISKQHVLDRYKKRYESRNLNREWWEVREHYKVFQQKHVYERHEHHLYDAKLLDIDAKIRKPKFISELLSRVPAPLRDFVKIAEGEMCKEVVTVSTVRENEVVEKVGESEEFKAYQTWSPAVLIDRYVLAGWSDSDL